MSKCNQRIRIDVGTITSGYGDQLMYRLCIKERMYRRRHFRNIEMKRILEIAPTSMDIHTMLPIHAQVIDQYKTSHFILVFNYI